jgi:Flp pilus assembly protein TadG
MTSRKGPFRTPRGAAAVEFALIVPVLLLIVLGTIDWGYYFFVQQVVTNAAREAARVGSLTPHDPANPAANPAADAAAEHDAVGVATAYITNAGLVSETPGVTPSTVIGPTGERSVRVVVSYPTGSVTGFLDLVPIMPAQAQAIAEMRR